MAGGRCYPCVRNVPRRCPGENRRQGPGRGNLLRRDGEPITGAVNRDAIQTGQASAQRWQMRGSTLTRYLPQAKRRPVKNTIAFPLTHETHAWLSWVR